MASASYRLTLAGDGFAKLAAPTGERWADLATFLSLDGIDATDESRDISRPRLLETGQTGCRIAVHARSTRWRSKRVVFGCYDDRLEISGEVEGDGELGDCTLLGGRLARTGSTASGSGGDDRRASRAYFRTVFNPEPVTPPRWWYDVGAATSIDVTSAPYPAIGHWIFTPPPLCYGLSKGSAPASGTALPSRPWLMVGLAAAAGEHNFTAFDYLGAGTVDGADATFTLHLAYDGQTRVSGRFSTPRLLFLFGAADPYAGLTDYAETLHRKGFVEPNTSERFQWWSEPIFCGWGAQVALAREASPDDPRYWKRAPDYSRQDCYDRFLETLARNDVRPGTVIVDDKWQAQYANAEPDRAKWPDLGRWIASRHDEGARVLLWWNSWGVEGLPDDQTIRAPDGEPVACDPSNPAYEAHLRDAIHRVLANDGLDADGLKVDFTASTPRGPGFSRHGREWGVELLRKLLATIYSAAKDAKRDALIETHAANPYFAAVGDMVRLNDMLRLEDATPDQPIVAEMTHRARVARAACPELLIDTDGWPCPNLRIWRDYLTVQPELGVPALYYATAIDVSGEILGAEDYASLRETWARAGSPARRGVGNTGRAAARQTGTEVTSRR